MNIYKSDNWEVIFGKWSNSKIHSQKEYIFKRKKEIYNLIKNEFDEKNI